MTTNKPSFIKLHGYTDSKKRALLIKYYNEYSILTFQ